MKHLIAAIFILALSAGAYAQSSAGHDAHHAGGAQGTASADTMAQGEVRKVDRDASKLTIKHGEIKNLGMPPMTMVFRVKDPAMLEQVRAGDRVRFEAQKIDGAYTVTKIQSGN